MKGGSKQNLALQDVIRMVRGMVSYIEQKIAPVLIETLKALGVNVTHMTIAVLHGNVRVSNTKKKNRHSKAHIYELLLPLEFEVSFSTEGGTLTRSFLWELSCLMTPVSASSWGVVSIKCTNIYLRDAPVQPLHKVLYNITHPTFLEGTPESRVPIELQHLDTDTVVARNLATIFTFAFLPRVHILLDAVRKGAAHLVATIEAHPHFIFPTNEPQVEEGEMEYLFSIKSPTPRLYLSHYFMRSGGIEIELHAVVDATLYLTFIPRKTGVKILQRTLPCEFLIITYIKDSKWMEGDEVDITIQLAIQFPQDLGGGESVTTDMLFRIPVANLVEELLRGIQRITHNEITTLIQGLHEILLRPMAFNILFPKEGREENKGNLR